MRPVDSVFIPFCAENNVPIKPIGKDIVSRIKNFCLSVFKWLREHPSSVVLASAGTLGMVALITQTFVLLPLAAGIYFITLGLMFHQGEKKYAAVLAKNGEARRYNNLLNQELYRLNDRLEHLRHIPNNPIELQQHNREMIHIDAQIELLTRLMRIID